MPKATVTVRGLKNKDTGVDLSVTTFRELPGLVRSTFEFQIVVVSNLAVFKLPSHKETDVVQFTLFKKFPDFEDLRARLNEEFCGTVLPPLVRKSIIVNEAVIKERRNSLDIFLKFISSTPRIVTSSHVLTFLDVDSAKAQRFASGDTSDIAVQEETGATAPGTQGDQEEKSATNLFDEEEEEEEDGDNFLAESSSIPVTEAGQEDFFSATSGVDGATSGARLFERQDLKRDLTVEDEKDFNFLPDAIITKREVIGGRDTTDDNDDLLNVDEDIDLGKLLALDADKKDQQQQRPQPQQRPWPMPPAHKPQPPSKPSIASKPSPARKPGAEDRITKPIPPARPRPRGRVDSKVKAEPGPVPAPRKLKPAVPEKGKSREVGNVEIVPSKDPDLSSDDIMKYIAANAEEQDAELDLFS